MNPHRKFKNHGLVLLAGVLCFITFTIFVLDTTQKNNRKKLQQNKPVAQQYTLNQSDPIWFYKPDEIGWSRGEVVYLWEYHPVIFSKDLNKTFNFHEVKWTTRYE